MYASECEGSIDSALDAFLGLFRGDNLGRTLVRLGEPSPGARSKTANFFWRSRRRFLCGGCRFGRAR